MGIKRTVFHKICAMILLATLITSAVAPSVGAARIRIHGSSGSTNSNDVKVVNAFTDSYEDFIDDIARINVTNKVPDVTSYEVLVANNDTLQKHSFKNLNDEYKDSTNDIKSEATKIVALAKEVNTAKMTNVRTTVTRLNDAMSLYNTHITAMTSAVEKYNQDKSARTKNSNKIFGIVAGAVGIVVVVLIVIFSFIVGKKKKEMSAKLFGDDPLARTMAKQYKNAVVELYNSMLTYEKYLIKGDKALMDVTKKSGYDLFVVQASHESLLKYRAVAYEYAALIAQAEGNKDLALQHLNQAATYLGNRNFYTDTARSIR